MLRWTVLLLVVALLAGWGVVWLRPGTADALRDVAGISAGSVAIGGPFTLTDQTGRQATDATWRGKWMLVYFGYTYCPDVCPTELQAMSAALAKLGAAGQRVVPIFISIDPARDTPAHLAEYVKLFDPALVGLTGTAEQIAAVAKAYRVYYAKVTPKDSTDYLMDHSAFVYLMGPDGKLRALFRPGMSPQELAEAIRSRLGQSS